MAHRADASQGGDEACHGNGFPLSLETWQVLGTSLHLSKRELEIVRAIFNGGIEARIAHDLNVSVHTVHSHLDRIHKKLHVSHRCALVVRIFTEYLSLESVGLSTEQRSANIPPTIPLQQIEARAL